MRQERWARGFTLIELLIVMALIAILASMLFPVFAKARGKARSAGCQSNEKQLAQALIMYTQDYDGAMPLNFYPYVVGQQVLGYFCNHSHWPYAVYAYHKSLQIFVCPDRPEWLSRNSCETGGYAVNGLIVKRFVPPLHEAALDDAAGTVLLVDSYASPIDVDDWDGPNFNLPTTNLNTNVMQTCDLLPLANNPPGGCAIRKCCEALQRHNGGMNVAYVDGHVKWVSPHFLQQRAFTPAND